MAAQTQASKTLVFNVEEVIFGIDIGTVKEVFKTTKIFTLPRTSTIIAGIVNLREQIVTIFNMNELLFNSSEGKALDFSEKESIIVLVNIKNQDFGLLVDQVIHLTDINELKELDLEELKEKNLKLTSAITNVGIASNSSSYLLDIEKMLENYLSAESMFLHSTETDDFDDFDYEQYTIPDSEETTGTSKGKKPVKKEIDDFDYEQYTLPDPKEEKTVVPPEEPKEEVKKKSAAFKVDEASELMKNMSEKEILDFTEGDNRKSIKKIVKEEPEQTSEIVKEEPEETEQTSDEV